MEEPMTPVPIQPMRVLPGTIVGSVIQDSSSKKAVVRRNKPHR